MQRREGSLYLLPLHALLAAWQVHSNTTQRKRETHAGCGAPRPLIPPLQAAALCLGPTKQPLPTHRTRRDPGRVEYGGLANNIPLITELAPVRLPALGAVLSGTDDSRGWEAKGGGLLIRHKGAARQIGSVLGAGGRPALSASWLRTPNARPQALISPPLWNSPFPAARAGAGARRPAARPAPQALRRNPRQARGGAAAPGAEPLA